MSPQVKPNIAALDDPNYAERGTGGRTVGAHPNWQVAALGSRLSRAGGPVLTELAKRLKADCAEVDVIEADITDEAAARGAFEQAVARFGQGLGIVVTCGVSSG